MVKEISDQHTIRSLQPHPFSCTYFSSLENDLFIGPANSIQSVVCFACLKMALEMSAMSWLSFQRNPGITGDQEYDQMETYNKEFDSASYNIVGWRSAHKHRKNLLELHFQVLKIWN